MIRPPSSSIVMMTKPLMNAAATITFCSRVFLGVAVTMLVLLRVGIGCLKIRDLSQWVKESPAPQAAPDSTLHAPPHHSPRQSNCQPAGPGVFFQPFANAAGSPFMSSLDSTPSNNPDTSNRNDNAAAPLRLSLMKMAGPTILGNLLLSLVHLAAIKIVASLGDEAVAAVLAADRL